MSGVPRDDAGPWPRARPVLMIVTLALVYAAAVMLGRMSRLPGTTLALVWPAAAVGFVWMLWASHRGRRQLAAHALLLAVIAGAVNWATGARPHVGLALGVANVVQALVELGVLARLRPSAWRLRRPADLGAWVTACVLGAAAGALIGPFVLTGAGTDYWALAGAWTLRNAANTFVFGALALRIASAGPGSLWPPRSQWPELVGALTVLGGAYGVVFGTADGLPLAYLVLPLSMWIALRFSTTMAAAHVLWAALLVVSLTMLGRGPFAATSPTTRVLLAQAFVAIVGLVALALALHRDEASRLVRDLGRAREQADAQAAELDRISQAKSDFLATMSHEIRTPLNGVLGFTALLAQSPHAPAAAEWAQAADTAGRSLLGIVNNGLDLAKIEAGGVQLESIRFDVVSVAREALLPCRLGAEETGLDLRLVVGEDLHRGRIGDPGRLRQVLTNLVANAVKFTASGSVTLSLTGASDLVRIEVVDTGIGMTDEQAEHMFEPFRQASADTARLHGGTGLGLTIAAGLVEAMGGGITVHSVPGVGTTFVVDLELPRASSPTSDGPASDGPAVDVGPLAGARVLVAEDNLVNQLVARATLQAHGLVVDVVGDGSAALGAALTGDYDAVFMDCQMPVLDGLEATRQLRAAGATLPVIAMTAGAFHDDRAACAEAGMTDFLPKPWKAEELTGVLNRLAAARRPATAADSTS